MSNKINHISILGEFMHKISLLQIHAELSKRFYTKYVCFHDSFWLKYSALNFENLVADMQALDEILNKLANDPEFIASVSEFFSQNSKD